MNKSIGGFGFLLCLLIGILVDQVALGILSGLFLGPIVGRLTAHGPRAGADEATRE